MNFLSHQYYKLFKLTEWEWLYSMRNPINLIRIVIEHPFQLVYWLSPYSKFFKRWALKKDIDTLTFIMPRTCKKCGNCSTCLSLAKYENELRKVLIDEILESL